MKYLFKIYNKCFTKYKITENPYLDWILFFPLLLIYIAIVLLLSGDALNGDEPRYLGFAENLLQGYYAVPEFGAEFLWNGPGYPLLLAVFIFLKFPIILIKLFNALLLFIGIVFLFKSLKFKIAGKIACVLSYLAGLTHPYVLLSLTLIYTEALSFFLITASLFFVVKYFNKQTKRDLFFFSLCAGYLILTKVFFAYVFLALGVFALFNTFLKGLKEQNKALIKLTFYPYILCLPYLLYTYNLTGRFFYWTNSGGSSLYSMSTPHHEEYGDWFPLTETIGDPPSNSFTTNYKINTLKKNHLEFIRSLEHLNGLEMDDRAKEKAVENILNNKSKYVKNIVFNFGRIAFRFPFTNREVAPLFLIVLILHFSFLLFPLVWSIYRIIKNQDKEFILVLFFFSIFLAGTLLLSAESRFIFPVYPVLIFLISYLFKNDTKIIRNNSGI